MEIDFFSSYFGVILIGKVNKFRKITLATLVTADGNQGIILPDKFTALVVMFLNGLNESADNFRYLVLPEELFLQKAGGDELSLLFQFIESLVEFNSCVLNIGIQVARFATFSFGALLHLIPQGRFDTLADIVFHSHTVHRDAHTHGSFPVFQQLGFLNEEKHIE